MADDTTMVDGEEELELEETSMRDDILAAADEVETDEVETEATAEASEETEKEISGEGEPVVDAAPAAHKPPVDWAPDVKAKFAALEPDVQAAIADRERGINETLQQTSEIRHAYDSFNQMMAPYQPMMQAEGVSDPMTAIKGLLDTTAALMMGSQSQKAQRIAQLINHYGVDINTLDAALVGDQTQDPGQARFEQLLNERLAPVNQLMQRVQATEQQAAQQVQNDAGQTIQQFAADAKNVHFDAVRNTMADFLDMASSRGQTMTIEEAYQRACMSDPQIAPLVTQQFQQQQVNAGQQNLAGKRLAGSSIHGRPAAAGTSSTFTDDMSLRETIAAQLGGNQRI